MQRAPKMQLPYSAWPEEDRNCWNAAFRLATLSTIAGLPRISPSRPAARCGPAMGDSSDSSRPNIIGLLARPPGARLDRKMIADYVVWRRRSCGDAAVAIDLHHLRLALGFICPDVDWSWLLTITKRIAAQAKGKPEKYHLVTSERLYTLGIELMNRAVTSANAEGYFSNAQAFEYRDGLIIALLALIPLRRRTLAALRIGKHLVKSGDRWALDIPAVDIKTKRPFEYPIRRICRGVSIHTWTDSGAKSQAQVRTPAFGRPIKVVGWTTVLFMTRSESVPERRSASRSIYTASAMPPQPYGRSKTRPTCEVPETCWAKHRFK